MRTQLVKNLLAIALPLLLTACNGFFEKDNTPAPTPLAKFTPEVQPVRLWSTSTGGGSGDEFLKMTPAVGETAIFTASANGTVTSISKASGSTNWRVNTKLPLTTGPGVGDGILVVGSRRGDLVALQQASGNVQWAASIPGEMLAQPAIAHGAVIVKAVDGYVRALAVKDGHELWSFQQVEPGLILRGSSAPLIRDHAVMVGFANGNLARLGLTEGDLAWQQTIAVPEGAFAIQRMIDIDADPIMFEHHLYVATYQGKIAFLDWTSGKVLWNHDISSYTGMVADENSVYITDAKGHLWAFGADSGLVNWRQTQLTARILSGPAAMGNYIVVGDAEGYLHWLNKQDGHISARESIGSGIYAAPIVENNVLYALTTSGRLVAYTLKT